jgi:hypothetical protein
MIIAFAIGLIGAILILANSKYLRELKYSIAAFILSSGLAVAGIYFILNASKETNSRLFFPIYSPLTALVLWLITRLLYKKYQDKEIILYLRGLFPVRHEERYVTKQEINITFILLVLSVMIPFIILLILL